jgi:hypothetical protein
MTPPHPNHADPWLTLVVCTVVFLTAYWLIRGK